MLLNFEKTIPNFDTIYTISGEGNNNANDGEYQIYYRNLTISGSNNIDGQYHKILVLDEEDFYKYSVYHFDKCDYKYKR